MFDLIYPKDPAPVAGGCGMVSAIEMLPVIETSGNVVSQAPRDVCHGNSMLLHPVVHLEIVDSCSRLYLQKRSPLKRYFPDIWDVAVGGHVSYGEYILEALHREASEELGLLDFNAQFLGTYVYESEVECELVVTFGTVVDYEPHPDGHEVSEGRFWTMGEIEAELAGDALTPTFKQEYSLYKDAILSLL